MTKVNPIILAHQFHPASQAIHQAAWQAWLINNPWTVLVGLATSVVSLAITVVFYYRNKKLKRIYYYVSSTNLVCDSLKRIAGLEVYYAGLPVETLTASRVIIWNDGNETITKHNIAEVDPITIQVEDEITLLDWNLVYARKENRITPLVHCGNWEGNDVPPISSVGSGPIEIDFDYLDHYDSIVIQLLHTGLHSGHVRVSGTLKGDGKLRLGAEGDGMARWAIISGWMIFPLIFWGLAVGMVVCPDPKIGIYEQLGFACLSVAAGAMFFPLMSYWVHAIPKHVYHLRNARPICNAPEFVKWYLNDDCP